MAACPHAPAAKPPDVEPGSACTGWRSWPAPAPAAGALWPAQLPGRWSPLGGAVARRPWPAPSSRRCLEASTLAVSLSPWSSCARRRSWKATSCGRTKWRGARGYFFTRCEMRDGGRRVACCARVLRSLRACSMRKERSGNRVDVGSLRQGWALGGMSDVWSR